MSFPKYKIEYNHGVVQHRHLIPHSLFEYTYKPNSNIMYVDKLETRNEVPMDKRTYSKQIVAMAKESLKIFPQHFMTTESPLWTGQGFFNLGYGDTHYTLTLVTP